MVELGITEDRVRALDTPIVRTADIDGLAAAPPETSPRDLSRVQRAAGRAVRLSQTTIPAAYTGVKVDVDVALARAKDLIRRVRRPVGLAELLIEAVAGLHGQFPLFFSTLSEDAATVRLADAPHVGVTVDLGEELYVPVIHDAAARGIGEIAHRLMEFRVAAAEGTFRAADLDGANIAITPHTEGDLLLAIPFVFPGHVCALAPAAPQSELVLDAHGQVTTRAVATIGLAYDQRVVNGRDAALFLAALAVALRRAEP